MRGRPGDEGSTIDASMTPLKQTFLVVSKKAMLDRQPTARVMNRQFTFFQ